MKVNEIIAENWFTDQAKKALSPVTKAFVPAAERETSKQAAKGAATVVAEKNWEAMTTVFGAWTRDIKNVSLALGISDIMLDTATHISTLNTQLKAGSISPEKYNNDVSYWIGIASAKIAGMGITKVVFFGGGKLLASIPFVPSVFGNLIAKTSGLAASAFGIWIISPEGNKAFTDWFLGEAFKNSYAYQGAMMVGRAAKLGYDKMMEYLGKDTPASTTEKGRAARGEVSATWDATPSPSDPNEIKIDPATGQWLNRSR